jgi:predicted KAP-like P-loop ATPase
MWSDNESDVDLLGFDYLVSVTTSIVCNESLLPATIGVYGDWGCGKSSLLKRVCSVLEKEENVLVLTFDGWLFEGYEDAKTALMGTILDEIVKKRTLVPAAKHLALNLLKRINVMEALSFTAKAGLKAGAAFAVGGPVGLGLSGATDIVSLAKGLVEKTEESELLKDVELDKLIKEDAGQNLRRGIREFRKDFGTLIKETKLKTLVIVIDDLDRCSPDTIIETLEAIKLFLFVPHTAFILGADERLVKYAVRRRFPELPGERAEVGRDYLEKLIQFDIRIPALGRAELETYINLLFFGKTISQTSEFFKKAQEHVSNSSETSLLDVRFNYGIAKSIIDQIPPELEEDLSIAQRIAPVLVTSLNGNPRQCKRFLNKLMMRIEMAKSKNIELKQRVLAKLMLLEYFRTEFFKRLAELQSEQQGRPLELAAVEKKLNQQVGMDSDSEADVASDSERESQEAKIKTSAKSKNSKNKSATGVQLSEESSNIITTWLSDSWMQEWLKSQPYLTSEDLRPYFFFSRDTLQGMLTSALQRMTPQAQEMLTELFHESEAMRNVALKRAKELSPGDATAIFQALCERVREEEELGAELSAFNRLCDWVKTRSELFSQFIAFLNTFPGEQLPISAITTLETIAKETGNLMAARELAQKWMNSSTPSRFKMMAIRRLGSL